MNASRIAIITIIALIVGCAPAANQETHTENSILAAFENDEFGDLHAVVVIQNGVVQLEQYFNGGSPETLVDVRSAGKSVTSLLFGVAVDQNAIADLDNRVETYWPDAAGSAIGTVRLTDLLTMRAGLDADANNPDSPGIEDRMDESDDPLAFALSVPRLDEPGTRYLYNSVTAYVAGIVIEHATGTGLEQFARDNLFEPLGIEKWDWQEDRAGQTKGQGNLFLTAPGFASIGAMVLNGGRFSGEQVVSSQWIEVSLTQHVDVSQLEPNAIGYGYYWYHQKHPFKDRTTDVFFASGNGGNKIYLVPEFNLVVTVMSRAYGQARGHRRSEAILDTILAEQQQ